MPYGSIAELPAPVRAHLPKAAQEIYLAAFNGAWEGYAARADREAVAHKVAWTAVKKQYRKQGARGVRK
ncbi:MAG: ChaB family protein [Burkholderiales bacterium]|nr:ChaB family protein [Burkholderiales bacterium]